MPKAAVARNRRHDADTQENKGLGFRIEGLGFSWGLGIPFLYSVHLCRCVVFVVLRVAAEFKCKLPCSSNT